MPLETTFRRMQ